MGINLYIEIVALCLVVLCITLYHILITLEGKRLRRPLVILYLAAIFYTVVDLGWPIGYGGTFAGAKELITVISYANYTASSLFAFIWFRYIERYLQTKKDIKRYRLFTDALLFVFAEALLCSNLWNSQVFTITDDAVYVGGSYRIYIYAINIVYYLLSCGYALLLTVNEKQKKKRNRGINAACYSLVLVGIAIVQYITPEKPFYTMGFMLICVLSYLFNAAITREERIKENHKKEVDEQNSVIQALTEDCIFLAKLDLVDNEFHVFRSTSPFLRLGVGSRQDGNAYMRFFSELIDEFVYVQDREFVHMAIHPEYFVSELDKKGTCIFKYRVEQPDGLVYYQTKLVYSRSEGDKSSVIIGISNVDEAIQKEYMNQEKLEAAYAEAEAASLAKSEFLSRMSHDIRTPINGVIGMIEVLKKNHDSREQIEDGIRKIESASKHLLALVNDVLDMSRIESNKIEIARKPINVKDVADTCVSIIQGQLVSRSIDFQTDYTRVLHRYLLGDAIHLRQVLINILGNAVKFTPDGGSIIFKMEELGVANMETSLKFTIADTGIGMSQEFIEHIWERFSQENVGDARTTYQGTGLGMSITKSFIDLMGGTIEVESELGKGTTFTIYLTLPIDKNPVLPKSEEKKIDLTGATILVAEDNELNREIAETILTELGMVVTSVEDGQEAVEAFEASEVKAFDAILMDIRMPRLDGIEATKAIRALDRSDAKTIPIIAMTANAFEEDRDKCIGAGMNEHLSKPIEVVKLVEALGRFISK